MSYVSMSGPLAFVKPELLSWARESAGLTVEQAAAKATVKTEKLASWESGGERPTIAQLRKLGSTYKRPLAVFFLPAPPKGWDPMKDFRVGAGGSTRDLSPELRLAIREAWERREFAVELADQVELASPGPRVTADINDDAEEVARTIRAALGVPFDEQRGWRSPETAFSRWRAAVESLSILVFSFPRVDVEEVRGFSISKPPMPVIGVNSGDAPAGRTFTLLHELTHLALRSGAVLCDELPDGALAEVFCNHVAGAVLVPEAALIADPEVKSATATTEWANSSLVRLSRTFSVSREVVVRRLLSLEKTSKAFYGAMRTQFSHDFRTWAEKRGASDGGPDYITTVVSQNGRFYTRLVLEAYGQHLITASDVATYLGVRTKHLEALQEGIARRAG